MQRSLLISLLLLAASAAPAPAAERELWATVNLCDTPSHPNEIGIRASLPARTVQVRFRVQYRGSVNGRWRWVRGANSGWQKERAREMGWSFEVASAGERVLRGVVNYRWTRRGRLVRRKRLTEVGHRSTAGADPANFSAATCRISDQP